MKYLLSLAVSIAAVFAPVKGMLIVTAVLITSDLILGVIAAWKRKEPITSAGLRRTLTKLFVYEVAIMLGFLSEHYITDVLPVVKLLGGLIALVEMKSVLENLNAISGTDLLKSVIEKLGSQNGIKND